MMVYITELNGRDNPILKATRDGVREIYRARMKGDDPKISMTISTEDIDVFEKVLPGITKYLTTYDVTLEMVEFGGENCD